MKKVKWLNVIKLLVLIVCLGVVIHDLYMVIVYPLITSNLVGWTYWGLFTFFISLCFAYEICEDFKEEIKKSGDITHTTTTHVNN